MQLVVADVPMFLPLHTRQGPFPGLRGFTAAIAHKTRKRHFQCAFWMTVVANAAMASILVLEP